MEDTPVRPQAVAARPSWGLGDVLIGVALSAVLSGVALAALASLAPAGRADDPVVRYGYVGVMAFLLCTWVGLGGWAWAACRVHGSGSLASDFRLRFEWPRDLGLGVLVGVGLLGANLIEVVFRAAGLATSSNAEAIFPPVTAPWHAIVAVVAAAIVTPVVEELFFRGLLLQSLLKRGWGPAPAVMASALAFGVLHGSGSGAVLAIAVTTLYGTGLGALAIRTGRLGPGIIAHATTNAIAVVAFLV